MGVDFTYQQSTGLFTSTDGSLVATGYSGNGIWMNQPGQQAVKGHGPLPQGFYTIQAPSVHPKLGPVSMELIPDPTNEMFGRGDFFIHGDNVAMDHTASDGCIVLGHGIRVLIATVALAGTCRLQVVP